MTKCGCAQVAVGGAACVVPGPVVGALGHRQSAQDAGRRLEHHTLLQGVYPAGRSGVSLVSTQGDIPFFKGYPQQDAQKFL